MNILLKQFNLPAYIDGLSFADASKRIQGRFKERTDPDSKATEKELLGRLKEMQEYLKAQKEEAEQPARDPNDIVLPEPEEVQPEGSEYEGLDEEIPTEEMQPEMQEQDLMSNINGATKQFAMGGKIDDPNKLVIKQGSVKGSYSKDIVNKIVEESLKRNVDPDTALAVAYGESRIGNLHPNIGQTTGGYNSGDAVVDLVSAIKDKADYAKGLDKRGRYKSIPKEYNTDEVKTLIAYNGFKLNRGNDSGSNKVYGMDIPAGGIDMVKNPLYAKKILNAKKDLTRSPEYQAAKKAAAEGLKNKYNMFQGQDYNKGEWKSDPSIVFDPTLRTQFEGNTSPKNRSYAMGGKINKYEEGGEEDKGMLSKENAAGSVSEILGAVPGIVNIGKQMFGSPNIDTSGATAMNKIDSGMAGINGAISGANMGSKLGSIIPGVGNIVGAGAGALLGGVSSLIGAGKANKKIQTANVNNTYAQAAMNDNKFDEGGDLVANFLDKNKKRTMLSSVGSISSMPGDKINELPSSLNLNIKVPKSGKLSALDAVKLGAKDVSSFVGNNLDKLRYAPTAMTLAQLAKIKKPEAETTVELDNRYKKNIYDEKALTNLTREETSANREAILSSSEGSGNAARANLLGVQLNATKAMNDAYMKMAEANARENSQEQTFNNSIDNVNLQQRNMAQDIRAKNEAAYETNKSMLQSRLGEDLGAIGQEELYKKFPELMGMDYDYKGKYKKNTTQSK